MLRTLPLLLVLAAVPAAQNSCITLSNLVDGYVEVPYSPEVVPQSGITVEAWVTYDETTLGTGWRWPTIVRQNNAPGQAAYFLRVDAGTSSSRALTWKVYAEADAQVTWNFSPGRLVWWTHVAATWDGSVARLFVDGAEVGASNGQGPLRDQGGTLRIGKGDPTSTPAEVWNGNIDEVRIWPFARTGGEIASTMFDELATIPGEVSTWNFNGDALDSSSGRDGAENGTVSYTASPGLNVQPFPGATTGASTPGCAGPIDATVASMPRIGSNDFALVAHRVPSSGLTLAVLGLPLASPLTVLGFGLWIDPTTIVATFTVPVDRLGSAHLSLPVPATAPPGITLAAQFGSLDPCGPGGVSASNVIAFFLIP